MGIHAIPVSQKTVDDFEPIFEADRISVEGVQLSEADRVNGALACFRLTSEQGGKIRLELHKDERFPPLEMICVVCFDAGFSASRVHDELYWKVVKHLKTAYEEDLSNLS